MTKPLTGYQFATRLDEVEAELDRLDAALVQVQHTRAIESDLRARDRERAEAENATFWFRRFMLSLQIGNGAGFLAAASIVSQVDSEAIYMAAVLAWAPATYFALGTGAAGLLPLIMAAHAWANGHPVGKRAANLASLALTTFAVLFFVCGMASVVVELRQIGDAPQHSTAEP
ncbi:MAG: hypothetical protein Q7V15_02140 [Phenylobacterium sp.]|uniref:hypothetical protein n=1 Tax=Phenylobacterium sp. TaxID=1871053 RepID=UPI002725F4AE|nr:hypothetical protein [Phenylobacterium sp.]MDO8900134.1 hypothetical protein [Phenylobacterium sp.]